MLTNYLKIAWRYLTKNKAFTIINLFGLTLGFGCFILLSLFIADEFSFDNFHSDKDNIYRIVQTISQQEGEARKVAAVGPAIGEGSVRQLPQIIEQTRIFGGGKALIGNDPTNRNYENIWITDNNFFDFFDFEFLYGEASTALTLPNSLVITQSNALKYFGEKNVVGKTLYTENFDAIITAVIKDFPANSHIKAGFIRNHEITNRYFSSWTENWNNYIVSNWIANTAITYIKTRPGTNIPELEGELTELANSRHSDQLTYSSFFELQPLLDIHLYSGKIEEKLNEDKGDPLYVYTFGIIALLILLIACFNYTNLSTAAASRRTREVGVRKNLGARKGQLILQYSIESLILSCFSLGLAVVMVELFLPYINVLINKDLSFPFNNIYLLTMLAAIVLMAGMLSSLYPAFFLSGLNPVAALKKENFLGSRKLSFKKVLVATQFLVSLCMITATIIIYQQLHFLQNKELGFENQELMVLNFSSHRTEGVQFESVKQEFERLPEVEKVTVSSTIPGGQTLPIAHIQKQGTEAIQRAMFVGIGENFLETYSINILEGRNLKNDVEDSNSVLITQLAATQLGLEDPIGQTLDINGFLIGEQFVENLTHNPVIVGVVEDFHLQSFRQEITPLVLASHRNQIHGISYYTLKIKTSDWEKTIADIREIYHSFAPGYPVEYSFLDNQFEQFYANDRIRGRLFLIFSGVVIFIAIMGLLALASFTIENRTKEIGIRKVLGASIKDITWILSGEFALMIFVAFLISIPVTYFGIQSWLQEFAYKISIPWWTFFLAGTLTFIIALGTISFQTVRAALLNPIETLKSE